MTIGSFFIGARHFLIPVAEAQLSKLPQTPCAGLVNCGGGGSHVILDNLGQFADLMLQIAAGAAVLFIVWAGFNMIISFGDESKVSQFKWGVIYALGGLGVVIVSQVLVSFVGTQDLNTGAEVLPVGLIGAAVSILLTLVNVVFIIAIIISGLRMVYAQGKSDEFNKGKTGALWAVGGAVVVNSANALVQALVQIFGV